MFVKYDIIFLDVPRMILWAPPAGTAQLKAVVEKQGYKSKCIDLNIKLWHYSEELRSSNFWEDTNLSLRYKRLFEKEKFLSFIDDSLVELQQYDFEWLGINLFTQRSVFFTELFLERFRELFPEKKVVLGGTQAERDFNLFLNKGLIDHYITGEGERSLVELLRGNLDYPGISGRAHRQIDDLNSLPFPDYSDVDFSQYHAVSSLYGETTAVGGDTIWVTGSRGCVRSCTFCDINQFWPKYRYRSASSLCQEFLNIDREYSSVRNIVFSDSLINGNVRLLEEFSDLLMEHLESGNFQKKIGWSGQIICKPKNSMPGRIYEKAARAGLREVYIGVESGSPKVRHDMKKRFNDEDIDFAIESCVANGIKVVFLMIVGFPSETERDFRMTLDMFTKYSQLTGRADLLSVSLGPTMIIGPGTEIWKKQKEYGVRWDGDDDIGFQWRNENSNLKIRYERWQRLKSHCQDLNYIVKNSGESQIKYFIDK